MATSNILHQTFFGTSLKSLPMHSSKYKKGSHWMLLCSLLMDIPS